MASPVSVRIYAYRIKYGPASVSKLIFYRIKDKGILDLIRKI